jgi:hypothetical protein
MACGVVEAATVIVLSSDDDAHPVAPNSNAPVSASVNNLFIVSFLLNV